MKIAIDARAAVWYRGTGIGTYTFQILRNILPLTKTVTPLYPEDLRDFNIEAEESYSNIFKDKFWEALHEASLEVPKDINLLHVPHNGMGFYKTDAAKIITLHDIIPYVLPDTVGVYYHKVFLDTMPSIVDEATRIITVSEHSKQDICRFFRVPPEKIDVIYEAPESIYKPLDKLTAKKYVFSQYGINYPYILYLGGFSPRKNVVRLVEAYHKAYNYLPQKIKLVIVGKLARNFQQVLELVDKYNLSQDIIFPGFVPVQDLPAFYNASDMFIYPSLYEGFGLPPLEAMACGIPTICSKNSSMPEVVGDGAHLVDADNLISITDGIIKIAEDENYAGELSRRGLLRAQEFSWQKAAEKTFASYQKALKEV